MTRDLRKYARQTNFRLAVGAILLLFIIGDGLIYFFYGKGAALLGILCILAGLTPVVLVVLIFVLMDWVRKRIDHG
jgi:hypothetical protein